MRVSSHFSLGSAGALCRVVLDAQLSRLLQIEGGPGLLHVVLQIYLDPTPRKAAAVAVHAQPQEQIFSSMGVSVRRMAVSSLVSMSACWEDMRSVVLQFSPSMKGRMPVLAMSCSSICRTGHLAVQYLVVRADDPDVHVAHGHEIPHGAVFAVCMAALHSSAISPARSWAGRCPRVAWGR
jgi:hypothetical protein